jgi:hypothetical protein
MKQTLRNAPEPAAAMSSTSSPVLSGRCSQCGALIFRNPGYCGGYTITLRDMEIAALSFSYALDVIDFLV